MLTGSLVLPNQPVVLNYRFPTPSSAQQVQRRDIHLRQCGHCGLIFNTSFEPDIIPYDENYENRQCHSTAFEGHLTSVAQRLIGNHHLEGGTLLEIGCGKGDFLRLICRLAGARGDGYDTSYLPGSEPESPGLQFHRQYVTDADIRRPYQAVLCRHVIEHVPEIGSFLKSVYDIARASGDPVVALETPRGGMDFRTVELLGYLLRTLQLFLGTHPRAPLPSGGVRGGRASSGLWRPVSAVGIARRL